MEVSWGLKTTESFHTYGTPAIEGRDWAEN